MFKEYIQVLRNDRFYEYAYSYEDPFNTEVTKDSFSKALSSISDGNISLTVDFTEYPNTMRLSDLFDWYVIRMK